MNKFIVYVSMIVFFACSLDSYLYVNKYDPYAADDSPEYTPSEFQASTDNFEEVYITWKDVPNAQKYLLYRTDSTSDNFSYLGSTKNTFYSDKSSQIGISYTYRIQTLLKTGKKKYVHDSFFWLQKTSCRLHHSKSGTLS